MKITTPNSEFTGTRAGVKFVDGVGQTDDEAALVSFRRHGYTIEDAPKNDEGNSSGDPQGDPVDPLADLTVDQLRVYAAERDIDLGDATKKDDIKASIESVTSDPDA